LWYDVNGVISGQTNSTFVTPVISSNTTYSVAITNGTCTSSKANANAIINSVPSAPSSPDVNNCGSGSVTLSASGGTNGNYLWYDTNGLISGQANNTYATPVIASTTQYSVAITNGLCTSSQTNVKAYIITIPTTPTTQGASACGNSSVILTASGGSNGNYLWYDINGLISGQTNSTYTTPVISSSTTYSVALTNGTCTSAKANVIATINAIPSAPTTQGASQCSGSTFSLSASGGTNGQYVWYTTASGGSSIPGEVSSTYITPALTSSTSYYVSINNGTCESQRSQVTATVITTGCSIPVITTATLTTQIGGSITLNLIPLISTGNNNLDPNSIVVIQQPPSGAVVTIANGVATANYSGINFSGSEQFTIRACDADGNCTTQVFTIQVAGDIVVYNGISPNGKNPAFIIEYINILQDTKENTVYIFDRWENQVWHGTNYDNSAVVFTGVSDNGNDLPSGVYYYKLNFSSGRKTQTGFLSLRRQ
jgi:gliding motility-associated-like protein